MSGREAAAPGWRRSLAADGFGLVFLALLLPVTSLLAFARIRALRARIRRR